MQLKIFDFDQTLTKKHTFKACNTPGVNPLTPENNLKSGVSDFLTHGNDSISAVASYHNNPDYIKQHIEKILGQKLTLTQQKQGDDAVISVYRVAGSNEPFIISTLRDENGSFNTHMQAVKPTGKMVQIKAVLNELQNQGYPATNFSNIDFYDDDINNITTMNDPSISAHQIQVSDSFKVLATKKATINPNDAQIFKMPQIEQLPPELVLMTFNDEIVNKRNIGVKFESRGGVFVSSQTFSSQSDAKAAMTQLNEGETQNKFYIANSSAGGFRVCITSDNAISLLKTTSSQTIGVPAPAKHPAYVPHPLPPTPDSQSKAVNQDQTILRSLETILGSGVEKKGTQFVSKTMTNEDASNMLANLKEVYPGMTNNAFIAESRATPGQYRVVVNNVNINMFEQVNLSALAKLTGDTASATSDFRSQLASARADIQPDANSELRAKL